MLTGKLVRVRYTRDRITPQYLKVDDPIWRETADRLLDLFRVQVGRTRGELTDDLAEVFGNDAAQLVHRGLAKLLEDRCEFETVAELAPEKVRETVFRIANAHRQRCNFATPAEATPATMRWPLAARLDRAAILNEAAAQLGTTASEVEHSLFADLKSEQQIIRFKDTTAERLLERYNVALAQAVLLRSTAVTATIRGEPPQRFRQLLRLVKFHRLICEAQRAGPDALRLRLDGPLSLFSATQKYGLQLALFLPAVLPCHEFDLEADLRWGPQRRPKRYALTNKDGLVSHRTDTGMYVPPELAMFADLFRKKIDSWDITDETDIIPLGDGFWVPDYRLVQRATGRTVFLEVLGFWRRSSVEKHLERLRRHAPGPFLLAVSDQLHIDDAQLDGLPVAIHRFRQMPLPGEVVRLAAGLVEPIE